MKNIGLYLHIPFCKSKCPYCDFYSFSGKETEKDEYTVVLKERILSSISTLQRKGDTLYIGGGTPSVLGAKNLETLVKTCKTDFLTDDAEITVECNPYGLSEDFIKTLYNCGVNRISMGLQSAVDSERRMLGRLSDRKQVENAVKTAQNVGFENITLDVMLGIPNQTEKSLNETLDFCFSLGVPHISAYMLKIEENTHFYKNRHKYDFPDDDLTADLYLQMCEALENHGIMQYEISNFAKKGYESQHNLKYWHCEEYLGLGPSAHSFLNRKRFYFDRDFKSFMNGNSPIDDGIGGDFTEYAMLNLRLVDGLNEDKVLEGFGHNIPKEIYEKSKIFIDNGYMISNENGIALTRKGFLMSNTILAEIL
ncbi:MAG: radical SAM family heme chaperone HemW [Clostridia bacterium]|nr:radical SAM family heme chaperone HemW [Clostridia bacterium]